MVFIDQKNNKETFNDSLFYSDHVLMAHWSERYKSDALSFDEGVMILMFVFE